VFDKSVTLPRRARICYAASTTNSYNIPPIGPLIQHRNQAIVLKLAVFTLESLANASAVRRFIADHADDIVFVGISNPYRKSAGGSLGQFLRHLRRSGLRFVPYLAINFSLPEIVGAVRQLWPTKTPPEKTPIAKLCKGLKIRSGMVNDLNDGEMAAILKTTGAELIISFHFDQIFDANTLAAAPRGGINVHPSLLPRHRGPVPTFYALEEQPPLFGVTVHRLVVKIDAGDILAQRQLQLPETVSALGAAIALHEEGRQLLNEVLQDIDSGRETATAAGLLPYCPFPSPEALKNAARRGKSLANLSDLWAAIRTAF